MGCLWSNNKKLKAHNELLNNQLTHHKQQLETANNTIVQSSAREVELLSKQVASDLELTKVKSQLAYIENVLNNPEYIAKSILSSSLNCEWLDDNKEKLYLISIIEFLYMVCIVENIHANDTSSTDSLEKYTPAKLSNSSPRPSFDE